MRPFLSILLFLFGAVVYGQSEQLAKNYFDQGEYAKALRHYEKLVEDNPGNSDYFFGLIATHQQLEEFEKAEKLLLEKLNNSANLPTLLVELGHNYALQKNTEKSELYYSEALSAIESRPNYAFSIARAFEKYSLLDRAVLAYEAGMRMNPNANYNVQLARLYGEQGKVELMFENYLALVEKNPEFLPTLYRNFSLYITEDPGNEANGIFRTLLLKKSQENQNLLFNEMLSWLFMQQGEYAKAFLQEKAIFRRTGENLGRIIQLALISKEEAPETSQEVLDFIIAETPSEDIKLQAHQIRLSLAQETAEPKEHSKIEEDYRSLLSTYGTGANTLSIQIDFANFLAFTEGKVEEAQQQLKLLLDRTPGKFEEAAIKMALADILVLDEKFNQALIYYTQVQNLVKNDIIAQDARFKVAKTSYFKGDFDWARTQLDVLKSSTSQLIANDAMEMSLLISDNSLEDSTQAALKGYARADLLSFQKKEDEAIAVLEEVLVNHKTEKIEDEALLKQAELYEKKGDFEKAEENYLKIIQFHKDGILGDNAHYRLAELYNSELEDPEKAKEFYEKIIFDYADSIYFVDSRKKYRELRGETVE